MKWRKRHHEPPVYVMPALVVRMIRVEDQVEVTIESPWRDLIASQVVPLDFFGGMVLGDRPHVFVNCDPRRIELRPSKSVPWWKPRDRR